MNLASYLKSKKLTASEFAEMLKVQPSSVTRWCRGEVTPKPKQMAAIHLATGGKVTPGDFYELES